MKTYEFGGKVYIQDKLVWGQVKQLASILKGITIADTFTVQTMVETLGDRLPEAIAVVLIEEGVPLKDKDLEAMVKEFDSSLPIDIAVEVVEDFFTCNPTALILEKLAGLMEKFQGNFLNKMVQEETPEK